MTNKQLKNILSQFTDQYIMTRSKMHILVRQAIKLYRRDRVVLSGPAFKYNAKTGHLYFFNEASTTINIYNPGVKIITRQEFLKRLAQALQIKDQVLAQFKNPQHHDNPTPVTPKEIQDYFQDHPWLLDRDGREILKKI